MSFWCATVNQCSKDAPVTVICRAVLCVFRRTGCWVELKWLHSAHTTTQDRDEPGEPAGTIGTKNQEARTQTQGAGAMLLHSSCYDCADPTSTWGHLGEWGRGYTQIRTRSAVDEIHP